MEWDKMLKILKVKRDRQYPRMVEYEDGGVNYAKRENGRL